MLDEMCLLDINHPIVPSRRKSPLSKKNRDHIHRIVTIQNQPHFPPFKHFLQMTIYLQFFTVNSHCIEFLYTIVFNYDCWEKPTNYLLNYFQTFICGFDGKTTANNIFIIPVQRILVVIVSELSLLFVLKMVPIIQSTQYRNEI